MKKIIIIGAGPTGLGAAWRLDEKKHANWHLYEQRSHAGGLASSYQDNKGFWWDFGGHVQFSHYWYFDTVMRKVLGNQWNAIERESWIWILNRFIPYPFQNNIHRLPKRQLLTCLEGLLENAINPSKKKPKNFEDWILQSFGRGIADIFLLPYNFKVWAHHPRMMSHSWVGERVATVDLERIISNIAHNTDDVSWGPNSTFKFPKKGGTGAIWKALANKLPQQRISYNKQVVHIDAKKKMIHFVDGEITRYDKLINTMPLDTLVKISTLHSLKPSTHKLKYSSVHVVGLGLKGKRPAHLNTKCWMYFPENDSPFFRATIFSNYAKANVPQPEKQWSLMLEVSESRYKPVNHARVIDNVVQGALNTKLIESKKDIVSTWYRREQHGYPTPSQERDTTTFPLLAKLERYDIYSRGRFGAWRYEVANQDHAMMQGVEVVDRLLTQKKEMTLFHPEIVNDRSYYSTKY